MKRLIEFEIPGPPKGKGRGRIIKKGAFHSIKTPEDTVQYENLVKMMAAQQMGDIPPALGAVLVHITAVFPIPASTSKKRQELMRTCNLEPLGKPDLDNIMKIICDAMNQIVYKDDSQITQARAFKIYGARPRVNVQISAETEKQ